MVVALAVVVPINFVQLNHTLRGESQTAKRAALAAKQSVAAGKRATKALCLLRKNYEDQARSTAKYLKLHPNGAPALGLSASYLKSAENKQLAAAKTLAVIKCKP